jgi:hypothetical protein
MIFVCFPGSAVSISTNSSGSIFGMHEKVFSRAGDRISPGNFFARSTVVSDTPKSR